MNYKYMGKSMMWNAERAGALAAKNYGGRKKHRAAEVSLNQRLCSDLFRQKRKAGIICSNDAKGCFDQIVHSVANICFQRLGLHANPVRSMLVAIQEMTHHVRTAFGDSEITYGNDPFRPPLQGLLQGNGAAGPGWTAICSPLIEMMRELGLGYQSWTAIRHEAIKIVLFGFVDDNDLVHSASDNITPCEDLIHPMQQGLSHWHGAIRASGGDLAPEKSYCYMIDFKWSKDHWAYRSKDDLPGALHFKDSAGNITHTVERLEVHEAREALGVQVRHDGHDDDEVQYLIKKAKQWHDAIRSNHVSREDAWYALNSTIMKTIQYPLACTTMTQEQSTQIMVPILKAGLNKAGVQRNLPRRLVYGSLKVQGLNLQFPWTLQLIQHLHQIMRHGCRPKHPT
ncbi:MAG TPA: hypothetical protein V6D20_08135, partial [Candidatus Obscuribacterales bacterium]